MKLIFISIFIIACSSASSLGQELSKSMLKGKYTSTLMGAPGRTYMQSDSSYLSIEPIIYEVMTLQLKPTGKAILTRSSRAFGTEGKLVGKWTLKNDTLLLSNHFNLSQELFIIDYADENVIYLISPEEKIWGFTKKP